MRHLTISRTARGDRCGDCPGSLPSGSVARFTFIGGRHSYAYSQYLSLHLYPLADFLPFTESPLLSPGPKPGAFFRPLESAHEIDAGIQGLLLRPGERLRKIPAALSHPLLRPRQSCRPRRANGVVANMDEFYEAFGVREGDRLWRPAAERVKIW